MYRYKPVAGALSKNDSAIITSFAAISSISSRKSAFASWTSSSAVGAFEKKELRSILEDAVDTEELVKTGRLNDVMSVELFIVKYSAA